jgi:hypothetical protein
MGQKKIRPEDVVAKVLEESGGGSFSPKTIRKWVDGKETMPPDLAPMLDAILANLPYHLRIAEAEVFWESELSRQALRDVAAMDTYRRRRLSRRQDRRARGCKVMHLGSIDMTPQAIDAVTAMSSAMGISRRAFIEQWLQRAIDRLMTEVAAEATDGVSWKKGESTLPSSAARHLAKEVNTS